MGIGGSSCTIYIVTHACGLSSSIIIVEPRPAIINAMYRISDIQLNICIVEWHSTNPDAYWTDSMYIFV